MIDLEIRTAISATPYFFRRIHVMAAALARLKGGLPEYEMAIYVGGDQEPEDLAVSQPWSRAYPIRWIWTAREAFRRESYHATARNLFRTPIDTRFLMFADADVAFVGDFGELFVDLAANPGIAGVMAHGPPVPNGGVVAFWTRLFDEFGLGTPPLSFSHGLTACVPPAKAGLWPKVPAYFNFGMVLGTGDAMRAVCSAIPTALDFINARVELYTRDQIALTLAMARAGVRVRVLPPRYNFPNDPRFDAAYPAELADIRILHYLRTAIVHRDRDFATLGDLKRLTRRTDLAGSNEILRAHLAGLYPVIAAGEAEA